LSLARFARTHRVHREIYISKLFQKYTKAYIFFFPIPIESVPISALSACSVRDKRLWPRAFLLDPRSCLSIAPLSANHYPWSFDKDFEVEPEGPFADVFEVQTDHIIESALASPFYLPQAGNAWFDLDQPSPMPDIVNFTLIRDGGAGSH
jgi:hypothetical protein